MRYSVAITAHRDLADTDYDVIFNTMAELLSTQEVDSIYFGGASGGDTVALQSCLDISCMNKPRLIVVLPAKLENQHPQTWPISKRANQLIELGLPITKSDGWKAYHIRDRYMVDHAEKTIAFWDGIKKGGTFNTKKYAEDTKKIVASIPIIGRNK